MSTCCARPEIDLTGDVPKCLRLAKIKVHQRHLSLPLHSLLLTVLFCGALQACLNGEARMLREILVPDPEDTFSGDVTDSRGRDSFVRELLRLAPDALGGAVAASGQRAQRLWTLNGAPVLTRNDAVLAGSVVVGMGATERFRAVKTL